MQYLSTKSNFHNFRNADFHSGFWHIEHPSKKRVYIGHTYANEFETIGTKHEPSQCGIPKSKRYALNGRSVECRIHSNVS